MSLTPSSHRSFLRVFHLLVLYFWCLMPCANGSLLIAVAKLADCSGNVVVGTGWVSIASALFGGCVGPSISLCALSWVALCSSFVPDIAMYFDRSKKIVKNLWACHLDPILYVYIFSLDYKMIFFFLCK